VCCDVVLWHAAVDVRGWERARRRVPTPDACAVREEGAVAAARPCRREEFDGSVLARRNRGALADALRWGAYALKEIVRLV
jgi:hypothetical protein